jgi:hypothetical protein
VNSLSDVKTLVLELHPTFMHISTEKKNLSEDEVTLEDGTIVLI